MQTRSARTQTLGILLLAALLAVGLAAPGAADDRSLVRPSSGDPYVFFILDTSGSMNWSPPCSAADFAAGNCSFPCPNGDCAVPRDGDDPASKFRQAKEAIAEVIGGSTHVSFGFATYNQDGLHLNQKHWLYRLTNPVTDLYDVKTGTSAFCSAADSALNGCFPALGAQEVFGPTLASLGNGASGVVDCDASGAGLANPGNDGDIGCYPNQDAAADIDDTSNNFWEAKRVQRLPKLGTPATGGAPVTAFIRYGHTSGNNGQVYRVTYTAVTTPLVYSNAWSSPANQSVQVEVRKCNSATTGNPATCDTSNSATTGSTQKYLKTLTYAPIGDFTMFDFGERRASTGGTADGWFGFQDSAVAGGNNTCNGWEINTDAAADPNSTYNVKQSTTPENGLFTPFTVAQVHSGLDYGDQIPFNWADANHSVPNQNPLSQPVDNKVSIFNRLGPSQLLGQTADPVTDTNDSFAVARYYKDTPNAGDSFLKLKDDTAIPLLHVSPLLPQGSTPIGAVMNSFRKWYTGSTTCTNANGCAGTPGWRDIAKAYDPDFNCRQVYVVFVTDGDETCGSSVCAPNDTDTQVLNSTFGVKTYVVGFGLQSATLSASNKLTCLTHDGGTGCPVDATGTVKPWTAAACGDGVCQAPETGASCNGAAWAVGANDCIDPVTGSERPPCGPILPTNKNALVNALNSIISTVKEGAVTFASAAVPSVQAQVSDKIYLTDFTPLNNGIANVPPTANSIWSGHVRSFLKPLPLVASGPLAGQPDITRICSGPNDSGCFLWDAGIQLMSQAPTPAQVATGTLNIGLSAGERRVLYGQQVPSIASPPYAVAVSPAVLAGTIPAPRRFFTIPSTTSDKVDLWAGLGIPFTSGTDATAIAAGTDVVNFTLEKKHSEVTNPVTGTTTAIDYILGDVFHSDPVVVPGPSNFLYFAGNLYNDGTPCNYANNTGNPGYQCFFNKYRCRRRMLFAGSNDGQLHAFDSGQFTQPFTGSPLNCADNLGVPTGSFDNGTGQEIFSFIPRFVMPQVAGFSKLGSSQNWTVDGSVTPDDVFIDANSSGTPVPAEREWRTVLVAGLREGGQGPLTKTGYYALDITQPDTIDTTSLVPQPNNAWVPSCITAGAAGCGTNAFPSELWEFSDRIYDDAFGTAQLDEDPTTVQNPVLNVAMNNPSNKYPDLGASWSIPSIGRIKVCTSSPCTGANLDDRFVAIFGGGLDNADLTGVPAAPPYFQRSGNWLYMVDIESGKVLYKRRIRIPAGIAPCPASGFDCSAGDVPSAIATLDRDQDGYIDTLFFGTTGGFLFKVDISQRMPIQTATVRDFGACTGTNTPIASCATVGVPRTVQRIVDPAWDPFPIFDTIDATSAKRKPIYYPPAVLFMLNGKYALGFGTGDREQLWRITGIPGRFFMLVDNNFTSGMAMKTEATLFGISPSLATSPCVAGANANPLLSPTAGNDAGWFMRLNSEERLIANTFAVSGIVSFTTYQPQTTVVANVCSRGGSSRIFTVVATNGNPVQAPGVTASPAKCDTSSPSATCCSPVGKSGANQGIVAPWVRYQSVPTFVTNPFIEQSATKNKPTANTSTADNLTGDAQFMMEQMKQLFPSNCRFANFRIDIKTIRSDTGLVTVVPVPQCMVERNWKEF